MLYEVNSATAEKDVSAIEIVRSLLVKLVTFFVSLKCKLILSLHVTSVADVAQHARHANLISIGLKSRQALVKELECVCVVALQGPDEADASEGRRHC